MRSSRRRLTSLRVGTSILVRRWTENDLSSAYAFLVLASYLPDLDSGGLTRRQLKDAIEKKLPLKIGAQVMLLANLSIENGLVNGSRGVIINWIKASEPLPPLPPGATASSCGFGTEPWKIEAAKKWEEEQVDGHLPEVYWCSGVTTVVGPHTWVLDLDSKNSVGRTQLPLALAWFVPLSNPLS